MNGATIGDAASLTIFFSGRDDYTENLCCGTIAILCFYQVAVSWNAPDVVRVR